MRKKLQKFGEYLQAATINDTGKLILGLIGVAAAYEMNSRQSQSIVIFMWPFILIFGLIIYFAVLFFSTEIVHWFGQKIVRLSKWYPEWYYRPRFDYYFGLDHNKSLVLYIKSKPTNQKAHLRLDFARVKLIGAREDQKYSMDVDVRNLRNKVLYNKEIESKDVRIVTISSKSVEGKEMLSFPSDYFGIRLFPGKYVYEFTESGTYKGAEFGGRPRSLRFAWKDSEEFELRRF